MNKPTRIPLHDDKELLFAQDPYPHWKLCINGDVIRYLDKFECQFIDATIEATLTTVKE